MKFRIVRIVTDETIEFIEKEDLAAACKYVTKNYNEDTVDLFIEN